MMGGHILLGMIHVQPHGKQLVQRSKAHENHHWRQNQSKNDSTLFGTKNTPSRLGLVDKHSQQSLGIILSRMSGINVNDQDQCQCQNGHSLGSS